MSRHLPICAAAVLIAAASSVAAYTTIHTFNCATDGCQPEAGVTNRQGKLHGPTVTGSLYKLAPSGASFVNMYQLNNSPDGMKPVAAMTKHAGELYGVAASGGTALNGAGNGTIFKINPATNSFSLLHTFNGADGREPRGQLLKVNIGGQTVMYGTTFSGSGFGNIFKFDLATQTILQTYNLNPSTDGAHPVVGLTRYQNFLYGTTTRGGLFGGGTLFKIDLSLGSLTVLHNFSSAAGMLPSSKLLLVGNSMYGTTKVGGANGAGLLYRFDPMTSAVSVLHNFGSIPNDGANPSGNLERHQNGIYGTTEYGGVWNRGTIFRFDLVALSNTTSHDLGTLANDGSYPKSGVMKWSGVLYGTTSRYPGTVFSHQLP